MNSMDIVPLSNRHIAILKERGVPVEGVTDHILVADGGEPRAYIGYVCAGRVIVAVYMWSETTPAAVLALKMLAAVGNTKGSCAFLLGGSDAERAAAARLGYVSSDAPCLVHVPHFDLEQPTEEPEPEPPKKPAKKKRARARAKKPTK